MLPVREEGKGRFHQSDLLDARLDETLLHRSAIPASHGAGDVDDGAHAGREHP